MTSVVPKITPLDYQGMRFLIMDSPNDTNIEAYIKEMEKSNVTDCVRISENTYDKSAIEAKNIEVHEMYYPDGDAPPQVIIDDWMLLVKSRFKKKSAKSDATIAVHCVAGLGRAPVLVAIALISSGGMDATQAVEFIRRHRRGAINLKQLNYLKSYHGNIPGPCPCVIM